MKRILLILIVLLFQYSLFAQIAITEAYYDTPFSETATLSNLHHSGEFIELFNYTTEDIDISGWILADEDGAYTFPQNTIIPTDNSIIVVPFSGASIPYFTNMFPSTVGKESQIIYQNKILLNNYRENVSLYMTSIRGILLPRHQKVHTLSWNYPVDTYGGSVYTINPYNHNTMNQEGDYNFNFDYYKKSLQINNDDEFQQDISITTSSQIQSAKYRNATPLELDFPYELVPLESIESVIDAILNNYDHFIGNSGVLDLLNNICDEYVTLITENTITDDVISERCPEYDEAGNFIGFLDECDDGRPAQNEEDSELPVQEDEYASKVFVAPNPTNSVTTISWEKSIDDLISEIIVVPVNGGQHIPIKYSSVNTSADVNLSTYPSGIYAVRFTFVSGQIVTKSIIKI